VTTTLRRSPDAVYASASHAEDSAFALGPGFPAGVVAALSSAVEDMGFDVRDSAAAPAFASVTPTRLTWPASSPLTAEAVAAYLAAATSAAPAASAPAASAPAAPAPSRTVTLDISGMSCAQCQRWVSDAIAVVAGVAEVRVSVPLKTAAVRGTFSLDDVLSAVERQGYAARLSVVAAAGPPAAAAALDADDTTALLWPPPPPSSTHAPGSVMLAVGGMSCASCVHKVQRSLEGVPGVVSADINLLAERASITGPRLAPEALCAAVAKLGFTATVVSTGDDASLTLAVQGMVCASCPPRIEAALARLAGVLASDADAATGKVRVDYSAAAAAPRRIVSVIEQLGYGVEVSADAADDGSLDKRMEIARWRYKCAASCTLTLPLFVMVMVLNRFRSVEEWLQMDVTGGDSEGYSLSIVSIASFALATPVQFWFGATYYVGAYQAYKRGAADMNVLIVIGTSAAYLYSCYALLREFFDPTQQAMQYFETSAMLLTFVSLGKWLEARAKGRVGSAIRSLMNLQPASALLATLAVRDDGESVVAATEEVPSALLQAGDALLVRPGAKVPSDATVLSGRSDLDESMVTGEAMPVLKGPGDAVIGGTVNVGNGALVVRATAVGSTTMLASIIKLVEDAQTNKAPIQAYADAISAKFVPGVLVVALAATVFWGALAASGAIPRAWYRDDGVGLFALLFGICVLVIACPCALGLATPTAVMAGTSVGAKRGILIKGGGPLETAHKLTTLIFDKTGTLTRGKPSVTSATSWVPAALDRDALVALAARAEAPSEHPLGRAVVAAAGDATAGGVAVGDFRSVPGGGVHCVVDGVEVVVGNRHLMAEVSTPLAPAQDAAAAALEQEGNTVVFVHRGGELCGMIAIADAPRPEAPRAVAELRAAGIDVWMVTGDCERTALAVAAHVGIPRDRVLAGVKPGDKAAKVAELQRGSGGKATTVAMVGDGVNDAPALAQADLGIALGAGADVALEAADVVLVRDDLLDACRAVELSRATFQRIRLNMLFSLLFNGLGIPIAAGAVFPFTQQRLPPELAAFAMALSSVSVVTSSALLSRWKPRDERGAWCVPRGEGV